MRNILLIFLLIFFSCKKKQELSKINVSNTKSSEQKRIHENKAKKFIINKVYNENDSDFSDVRVNYAMGTFIIDNDFVIDTTLSKDERYFRLRDYKLNEYIDDRNLIRISNYTFSLQKNNGFLNIGLFRRTQNNKWKCKDLKKLESYAELGDYNYILGDNKVFSYTCETSKGDFCFAVVTDKVNSLGKYDQILKAVKFDLVNEKIIEVDLQKEKIECLPEMSDE